LRCQKRSATPSTASTSEAAAIDTNNPSNPTLNARWHWAAA
jgi:hypothetical protein